MSRRLSSLPQLLSAGSDGHPAIGAPDQADLNYADLRRHVIHTIAALNQFGIGRNDRVGIVLKNGPEMGSAFISIACGATAAPLNPGYRTDEFEFYLSDLNARALVVEQGSDTPARAVAHDLHQNRRPVPRRE